MVSRFVVDGPITARDLGSLQAAATISGSSPAQRYVPDTSEALPVNSARTAAPNATATRESKRGLRATGTTAPTMRLVATGVPDSIFRPSYGRFDTEEFHQERSWRPDRDAVELKHQLVFDPGVLANFAADPQRAYEHNVVVDSPRTGIRPGCNPLTNDNFYIRSDKSGIVSSNIPADAHLYDDDATYLDECSKNEVTFGIVYPERLQTDHSGARQAVYVVDQVSVRNDTYRDRPFSLVSTGMHRNNVLCNNTPDVLAPHCIGIRGENARDKVVDRREGEYTLPTCIVWKWLPVSSSDRPDVISRCGSDTDEDGFDDTVDCRPLNPEIHPGAIDVPNDGIDQDCDGEDLIVGDGQIRVTLMWDNGADQDLHVIEPNGERIWYSERGPTNTGGFLDRDANVGACSAHPGTTTGVENVHWADSTSPDHGTYTVHIVEYSASGCSRPAQWTAQVFIGGALVTTRAGAGEGSFTFEY